MAKIIQFKDENDNLMYPVGYNQGGVKCDLLWTNSSPTSSFSAQTISLDLSEYENILLIFKPRSGSNAYSTIIGFKTIRMLFYSYQTDYSVSSLRYFTISDSGITFESGYKDASVVDDYAVPYQIYGIKLSYVVPTEVNGLQYVEVE